MGMLGLHSSVQVLLLLHLYMYLNTCAPVAIAGTYVIVMTPPLMGKGMGVLCGIPAVYIYKYMCTCSMCTGIYVVVVTPPLMGESMGVLSGTPALYI